MEGLSRTLCRFVEGLDQGFQFLFVQLLDADVLVSGFRRQDELVELCLHRLPIAILRVLQEEHHQKGDDRRACVDDEFPRVTEAKKRPGDGPQKNDDDGSHECARLAGKIRNGRGKSGKEAAVIRLGLLADGKDGAFEPSWGDGRITCSL